MGGAHVHVGGLARVSGVTRVLLPLLPLQLLLLRLRLLLLLLPPRLLLLLLLPEMASQ